MCSKFNTSTLDSSLNSVQSLCAYKPFHSRRGIYGDGVSHCNWFCTPCSLKIPLNCQKTTIFKVYSVPSSSSKMWKFSTLVIGLKDKTNYLLFPPSLPPIELEYTYSNTCSISKVKATASWFWKNKWLYEAFIYLIMIIKKCFLLSDASVNGYLRGYF